MAMGLFLISQATAHANILDVPDDTILINTPLFDPIVVEDSIPDFGDGKFIGINDTIPDITAGLRSGTNYKVGTPSAETTVSQLGAAVWNMAFDIPQGVGGMVPNVGLSYSSQSGNGIVGWGVSISGISCISRGLKTIYHDGAVRGVKYDAHDALFLDGQRLLLSSGTECTAGAIYVLEGNPYTTVKVISANSTTGPLSFEVTTPDGVVSHYGTDSSSRLSFVDGGNNQRIHSWYVCRQEDSNGNYVEYSYTQDHYVVYPETISYGKNTHTGTGASNYIRFSYSGVYSGTIRTFVIGGVQGGIYKCLTNVRTMTGNDVYREYVLTYDPFSDGSTLKFERLSTITCKNGAGDEMKPVVLQWNLLTSGAHTTETLSVSTNDESPLIVKQDSMFLAADLNGDGLADIVRISNCQRYYSTGVPDGDPNTWVYIHRSVRVDNDSIGYGDPIKYNLGMYINFKGWKEILGGNLVADVDGDGLNDLVLPYYYGYTNAKFLKFKCILGKHVRTGSPLVGPFEMPLTASEEVPPLVTGDFDGNGIEDILYLENKKSNGYYYMGISFRLPASAPISVSIPMTLSKKPEKLFTGDFNCDGLPDIIALYDGGHKIFLNNGGGAASSLFSNANSVTGTSFGDKWRVVQSDFNGDGLVDFLYVGENSQDYYFVFNNGNSTFTVSLAMTSDLQDQTTGNDDHSFTLTPTDIDHDGLTDLVVAKAKFIHHGGLTQSDTFSRTLVGWFVSDGSSLSEVRRITSYGLLDEAGSHNVMLADFNGDGWLELANNGSDWYTYTVATQDGCHLRVYHPVGFSPSSGKLSVATDALGAATTFSYGSSASPSLYIHLYDDDNNNNLFPLVDVHFPVVLVSSMVKGEGLAGTHTTDYRYRGLKAHMQGKGVLGFNAIAAQDNLTGVTTQNGTEEWDSNYYVPSKTYTATSMGYDNDSVITTMAVSAHAKSRYLSLPQTKRVVDMEGNVTTSTYSFNTTYGYPLYEHVEFGSGSMYRKTSYSNYVKKGGKWLPQKTILEQKHVHDSEVYRDTTCYEYDNTGNETSIRQHADMPMRLTTVRTYDSYGNILSSTPAGIGVASVTTHTQYDATGRFPIRVYQNVDSGEKLYTYDLWGNILTATEMAESTNPLTTTYTLDRWGDATAVTSPEGVTTTITMGWGGSMSSAYYVRETAPGRPPLKTWFDVRGRTHQKESTGLCGTEVVQTFTMNGWGKTTQEVSRVGMRAAIEMTSYDYRGRATQTFRTGHGYNYLTYGNRSSTTTHDGRAYTTVYDAWGNPLETTDPGGTVTYTYGSNGLPSEVEAGNSVVSIEYDEAGNKTLIDDPDAGTSTFSYTADGKILAQTDGRGIQTVNTYDSIGRLRQTVCDTLVTLYTYGTTGNGKVRLVREETNGRANEYTYDTFGRITFDKRIYGDGVMSGHTYVYDSLGRTSRHEFPSGLVVDYTYDGNGDMQCIICNGANIWHTVSCDGWTTVEGFGNTEITTKVTQAGQLAERYVQHISTPGTLHRMAFTWHGTRGNLLSRTGIAGSGVTETFSYDALDRLTGVSMGGNNVMAMSYADGGNILSKTGLGAYSYASSRPHAVTGVENTGGLIASPAQQVCYNPWGKTAHIEEGNCSQNLLYGPDGQRWKVVDRNNGQTTGLHYLHGDYEWRQSDGTLRRFHYIDNGVVAMKQDNGIYRYYYVLTDNVGSVVRLINGEGGTVFEASYDAWGRPSVTRDDIGFPRGFGGHEMLSQFGLVNMDGRMYDYTLGRFLSPDDYVQEPGNSQSFNRYSYCLNNPLKYTDPTGELFGIDDLIIGVSAFVTGYVANGITTNNWGWKSVQNGLVSAGMSLIGWHSGGVGCSAWSIAGKNAVSNIVNAYMPSANFPIDRHFSFSISPVFGFGTDGLTAGFFESVNYSNGNKGFSIGYGAGASYAGWKVYAKSGNWGIGYGRTQYEEGDFNGNYLGPQETGTISLTISDVSIDYSNDYFGDHDDRWRTTAAELTIGKFSVGSYVYGNQGGRESGWTGEKWKCVKEEDKPKYTRQTKIPIVGTMNAWKGGKVYYAPFWLGYSQQGNIYRIGMSGKVVHRLTQNLFHKIISFPAYDNYANTIYNGYSYYGRHNPISIW